MDLPELVAGSDTKIAPIVSGARACQLILKMWDRKYKRTADFIVVEGPMAGGHLGFSNEQLDEYGFTAGSTTNPQSWDQEIKDIIAVKKQYEEQYRCEIPVVVAGGIFDHADIMHAMELGADGVQLASRFVATYECDASDAYKQAYLNATQQDVQIIKSPVGMPGRALNNAFVKKTTQARETIKKCYQCLEKCNPAQVPYCITKALVDAVKGDTENGLMFCGANVGRINRMMSVRELMQELCGCV